MASKLDAKVSLLREINLKKTVLFGAFGSNISNSDKEEEWKKIHRMGQSLSLCNVAKDWKYTRDVIWANFRRRTLVSIIINHTETCVFAYNFKKRFLHTFSQIFVGKSG